MSKKSSFLRINCKKMLNTEEKAKILLANRHRIIAYFLTITKDFHHAEDLFQEICVVAVGENQQFKTEKHLLNWAYLTGKNRAIDELRKKASGKRPLVLTDELLNELAEKWCEEISPSLESEALAHCIELVTPYNKELLRLRYFEGRSCGNIAEITRKKLETIYQALSRLHKSLSNCVRARLENLTVS